MGAGLLLLAVCALPEVPFAPEMTLEAGASAVVEAPLRLPAGLHGARARVEPAPTTPVASLYPELEVVARGRGSRLRWLVGAGPEPGAVALRFDVVVEGPRRVLRRVRVRQRVVVTPRRDGPDAAARALEASIASLERVGRAAERPETGGGPPLSARPEALAWAARHRLRALARRPDPLGRRAYAAAATDELSPPPSDATAVERLTFARDEIAAFRPESAERALTLVRTSSSASRGELARTLEMQGCLQTLRNRETSGRQLYAQALALVPELEPECPVPWARDHFAELRPRLAPPRPLSIGRVGLEPIDGALDVTIEVGPDPGRLARTVELEIQPRTDAAPVTMTAPVQHAGATGRGHLVVPTGGPPSPQVPVRVRVLDEVGILLAEAGAPAPLYVPLPRDEKRVRVPPWVWWVAGGLAVAGGTAAAVVVATEGRGPAEPQRGLGPIDIRF